MLVSVNIFKNYNFSLNNFNLYLNDFIKLDVQINKTAVKLEFNHNALK